MTIAANKRASMTLFSGDDIYSHQVRIVLAEKGAGAEIQAVDLNNPPEDFIDLNPYQTLPTLIDRELVLYEAHIILEYLDERFPHPPLMPVYPVTRAKNRLMMHRIHSDWYSLLKTISKNGSDAEAAKKQLTEELLALAPIFADTPYFMSEEFSLIDCYLAPLLWRLPALGINLQGNAAKPVLQYAERVFKRESFVASIAVAQP